MSIKLKTCEGFETIFSEDVVRACTMLNSLDELQKKEVVEVKFTRSILLRFLDAFYTKDKAKLTGELHILTDYFGLDTKSWPTPDKKDEFSMEKLKQNKQAVYDVSFAIANEISLWFETHRNSSLMYERRYSNNLRFHFMHCWLGSLELADTSIIQKNVDEALKYIVFSSPNELVTALVMFEARGVLIDQANSEVLVYIDKRIDNKIRHLNSRCNIIPIDPNSHVLNKYRPPLKLS